MDRLTWSLQVGESGVRGPNAEKAPSSGVQTDDAGVVVH